MNCSRPGWLSSAAHACRFAWVLLVSVCLLGVPGAGKEKKKPEKPLDINAASVAELVQLPGVGEVIARAIVRHREKSGKFRRVEELLVIRGISRKKFEQLRPYVTVEADPSAPLGVKEAKEAKEAREAKEAKEKD